MDQFKVGYFTNIAPHYRSRLWFEMAANDDSNFHLFFGKTNKKGIKEIDFDEDWRPFNFRLHRIKNVRFKSLLIYQFGVVSNVIKGDWDAVILLGDMYILSNWFAAILAKMKGVPVYFWGHGLYGNESKLKLFFRKSFLSIAKGHFLYGNYSKQLMINQGFDPARLTVVYNSLDYDTHLSIRAESIDKLFFSKRKYFTNHSLPVLLFIGRLTTEKKINLLIESVKELKSSGTLVNLLIIGDGPVRDQLEGAALQLTGQIHFYGECYAEDEIGLLIANSDLCVSPGNVGLTAIHSLSFGTPVCTHNDMTKQMPEAEAIIEGRTGLFYNRSKCNLTKTIEKWLSSSVTRDVVRNHCYEVVDKKYNPHVQLRIFKETLLQK